MTVSTEYFDWGSSGLDWDVDPYEDMSPALISLFTYLEARWGGYGYSLDDYDRPIRKGKKPSTHSYGAALDYRWQAHPDVTARAWADEETLVNEIVPFLIENSAELGIQHVMCESGIYKKNSWMPPAYRDSKGQTHSDGWRRYKNTYGGWIHIEVHPDHFADGRPVEEKLGVQPTEPTEPVEPASPWPVFDPEDGLWGLWPLNRRKPVLHVGSQGEAVRYLQGVISRKAGGNIRVDGQFGTQTAARVGDIQRFFRLSYDERCGRNTWAVIDFLSGL